MRSSRWLNVVLPALLTMLLVGNAFGGNVGAEVSKLPPTQAIMWEQVLQDYSKNPPKSTPEKPKIVNITEEYLPTVKEIREALQQASEITGKKVTRVYISPAGINPEIYKKKIQEYRKAGINVISPESSPSYTDCSDLTAVYSLVHVEHSSFWERQYFAKDVTCTSEYSCSILRPEPESSYSDIHFEDWFYFYSNGVYPSEETRGLIVFAGGNNSCGVSSTHVRDRNGNLMHYSDFPLDDPDGFDIVGWHILTTPCPHGDCYTGDSWLRYLYPQRLVYRVYYILP